jgi:hypothetical protein
MSVVLGGVYNVPVVIGRGVAEEVDMGFLEDDDVPFGGFGAVEEG